MTCGQLGHKFWPPYNILFRFLHVGRHSHIATTKPSIVCNAQMLRRREAQSMIRRISEACDTCRGKKRRCPGERPQCSLCDRLGQECSYRGTLAGGRWPNSRRGNSYRTQSFSQRDSSGVTVLRPTRQLSIQQNESPQSPDTDNHQWPRSQTQKVPTADDLLRVLQCSGLICSPDDFIRRCLSVYLDDLHNQPYPMFVQSHSNLEDMPEEVLFAILALTCTVVLADCDDDSLNQHRLSLLESAWKTVSAIYVAESPDQLPLSFLQSLCLVAQADMAYGNVLRAQTSVALGLRVAQIQGLFSGTFAGFSRIHQEECTRCVWSLFILDRVTTAGFDATYPTKPELFRLSLPVPDGRVNVTSQGPRSTLYGLDVSNDPDSGPMPLLMRAFLMWGKVVEYVFDDNQNDQILPWETGSYFHQVEAILLDMELIFHPVHRYTSAGFPARAIAEVSSRPYFSTWLCFQLVLHGAMCTLHHPFVIHQKLHRVARKVPPTFLQKSYETSMIHSGWVLRLTREMQQANLVVEDPFITYLVSIAGSIQLEHTKSKHSDVAAAAKHNFESALVFTKQSAARWRPQESRYQLLLALAAWVNNRQSITHEIQNYDGAIDSQTADNFSRMKLQEEDVQWMRRLLGYARPPLSLAPQPESYDPSQVPDTGALLGTLDNHDLSNVPSMDDWLLFNEPWMSFTNVDQLMNHH